MKQFICICLAAVCWASVLKAQDIQGSVAPDAAPVTSRQSSDPLERMRIIRDTKMRHPISQHVMLIIDISGSMKDDDKLIKAVELAQAMATRAFDDYYLAMIAFNDEPTRWAGVKEEHLPPGWASMPTHHREALAWVNGLQATKSTKPDQALRLALADPQEGITVILITDGEFNSGTKPLEQIRLGQQDRIKRKLGRATLMIFGIGAASAQQKNLLEIVEANEARGGFYVQD